jgi:hypothetical protein
MVQMIDSWKIFCSPGGIMQGAGIRWYLFARMDI